MFGECKTKKNDGIDKKYRKICKNENLLIMNKYLIKMIKNEQSKSDGLFTVNKYLMCQSVSSAGEGTNRGMPIR